MYIYGVPIDELCLGEGKRRLVQPEVWAILHEHFPTTGVYPALHKLCQQCMVSEQNTVYAITCHSIFIVYYTDFAIHSGWYWCSLFYSYCVTRTVCTSRWTRVKLTSVLIYWSPHVDCRKRHYQNSTTSGIGLKSQMYINACMTPIIMSTVQVSEIYNLWDSCIRSSCTLLLIITLCFHSCNLKCLSYQWRLWITGFRVYGTPMVYQSVRSITKLSPTMLPREMVVHLIV